MKKSSSFILAITFLCFSMICISMSSISVNAEVITDVTGPTITEAYCDKQGQVLKPGDTVYFSFKAYDESGLSDRVSVNFYEATSYSGRSFNWVYNSSEDKYETTFTIPSSAKNGEYYISTIYMYDIHGNQTALSTHLGFRVEGSISDTKGPTIAEAYCDKQGQVLKPGDTVYFSFKAYDESGLSDRVSVNFYEATSYSGRSFNWVYNSSEDKYETTFTVPSSVKMGAYYISTIYMYDTHGNQTALSTHLGFYIEPDGHTEETVKGYDATCTETGLTDGVKCSICGEELTSQTEIAANGHSYTSEITTPATHLAEGVMTCTCSVCGATKTEVIEKLQPAFTESEDAILTDDGNICTNVGKTAESLLAQASDGATLVDKNGNALSAEQQVGTGAVLTLADGTQYEIIVPGDVDGDGNISAADARLALRASVGLETYDETSVQYKAAKVESADTISASDARLILRASVGLDDPNEWFEKIYNNI